MATFYFYSHISLLYIQISIRLTFRDAIQSLNILKLHPADRLSPAGPALSRPCPEAVIRTSGKRKGIGRLCRMLPFF